MWADNETDSDLLGFDYLVDGLVVALTEPRLLPVTVGVLGDWGSGKSSLMKIAAAVLAAERPGDDSLEAFGGESSADDEQSPYLCIDFSPWQYEDLDDVKVALINTVLEAVQERFPETAEEVGHLRTFGRGFKRWTRRFGRFGAMAAPTAAPLAIQALNPDLDQDTIKMIGEVTKAVATPVQAALEDKTIPPAAPADADQITDVGEFRVRLAQLIERQTDLDAVVVFVDDLDRCLPETVVDTFEAIRLFLSIPKTAYVLALNQAVVESAIDSRYPDLKRADGAGLGRDYLEKMLQLKIAIPPLSAPEAETYANLLFAEMHLETNDFATVTAATEANRRTNALAVAFNLGIAASALENVPDALAADLSWAANIMPVLGASLRGNPRQLKRFLNNLMLKHRSAARRGLDLKLPVLAKMMVLEERYNSDFQRVFDWQVAAAGASLQLVAAESRARATIVPAESGTGVPDRDTPSTQTHEDADTETEIWADKPHIAEWLRVDPPLASVDLSPYFTYSRDKLSFGVSMSRLAHHLQLLLTNVQNEVEKARRAHYEDVSSLDPAERAQFIEALLDRVLRNPDGVALTAAVELAEKNADLVDPVAEVLLRIPPVSVPISVGSQAVRRLPAGHAKVEKVFEHWAANGPKGLQTVVATARAAQAKRAGRGGNLR